MNTYIYTYIYPMPKWSTDRKQAVSWCNNSYAGEQLEKFVDTFDPTRSISLSQSKRFVKQGKTENNSKSCALKRISKIQQMLQLWIYSCWSWSMPKMSNKTKCELENTSYLIAFRRSIWHIFFEFCSIVCKINELNFHSSKEIIQMKRLVCDVADWRKKVQWKWV